MRPTTAGIASKAVLPMTIGASWAYTFTWRESRIEGAPLMDVEGFKGYAEIRRPRDGSLLLALSTENGRITVGNDESRTWNVAVQLTEAETESIVIEGFAEELRMDLLLYDDAVSPRFVVPFISAEVRAQKTTTILP